MKVLIRDRRMKALRPLALALVALGAASAPARADLEVWTPVEARGSLGPAPGSWAPSKWRAIVEWRQKLDATRGTQVFMRTGPMWEFGGGNFLALHGTASLERPAGPGGPWGLERRLELEPNFRFDLPALALNLTDRNRLELRDTISAGLRWRYRNLLRLNYTGWGAVAPFVWDEVLWDLSGAGFNQNRLSVGLAFVPKAGSRIDVGLLQRLRRADERSPWDADFGLVLSFFADPGPAAPPHASFGGD